MVEYSKRFESTYILAVEMMNWCNDGFEGAELTELMDLAI